MGSELQEKLIPLAEDVLARAQAGIDEAEIETVNEILKNSAKYLSFYD